MPDRCSLFRLPLVGRIGICRCCISQDAFSLLRQRMSICLLVQYIMKHHPRTSLRQVLDVLQALFHGFAQFDEGYHYN